jgi:hypothetical protein
MKRRKYTITAECVCDFCPARQPGQQNFFKVDRDKIVTKSTADVVSTISRVVCPHCKTLGFITDIQANMKG